MMQLAKMKDAKNLTPEQRKVFDALRRDIMWLQIYEKQWAEFRPLDERIKIGRRQRRLERKVERTLLTIMLGQQESAPKGA